ncbi:MAG: hypothetical protein UR56_C0014G0012 [Candidatus Roizmanbacteria bacterium GW2011_GWC2_34_23]|uniref:LytR/CpsA/Psr regulator C-terminal domain-containing protein n=1 Tax=Candidatus Roizmanbacteria bacterium GW2011_GWC2_34_23 TaxID=1618484 RepID=A0A0G0AWF2_9BACT|nr:MAG: hypothetical protein UR56_C0014G0012 [Candidatus Roizmanbacteria bacterium GW2011_GWC2_34_23]
MEYHKKIFNFQFSIFNKKNLFILFVTLGLTYYLFKSITSSVFLKGRDKINVVFYGEKTRFYSLDQKNVNYLLSFSNLVKVIVPGGYGKYKVGAVGKLASLEKKPDIIRKTFSATTSTLVDLYFYQKKTTIYYDNSILKQTPTVMEILLTNSNANLIDKLFLLYIFSTNGKESFQIIDLEPFESEGSNSMFDYNSFYKKFQGSFFQRAYRNYDINVQIVYTKSYKTAQLIGQMIEGEGIRVVDLLNQEKIITDCLLITDKKISTTKTYQRLADFFKCKLKIGETTVSDIILELGDLEKEWAVN